MKTVTFYKILFLALVVINLTLVAFLLLSKHPPPPHPSHKPAKRATSFTNIAGEMLNLDDKQNTIFKNLAQSHNNQIRNLHQQEKKLIQLYFQRLYESNDAMHTDSIIYLIEKIQSDKLEITYKHFEAVKSILTLEQKERFSFFMDEALSVILPQ